MDISRDKLAGTDGNPHIWLRYTTQFSTGGRTHTIEMGIPVPVGASAEMREQLIREAEMGMEQLTRRVESRVSQMLQRGSRPTEPARAQESATLRPSQGPLQDEGSRSIPGTPAREAPQSLSLPEKPPAGMPVRQGGVVNMPVTPGVQGDANSMKLSQFMQIIREAWGLTPKQAMDLLNVKTLNGMNYREALRQLQPLMEGDARSVSTPDSSTHSPIVSQPKPAEERGRAQGLTRVGFSGEGASEVEGQKDTNPPDRVPARGPTPHTAPASTGIERLSKNLPVSGPQGTPANSTPGEERGRPQGSPPNPTPPPPLRKEAKQGTLAGPANIPVIPIKDDMIREVPRKAYKFDEEDEETEEEKEEGSEEQRAIARIKLDELKEVRGTALASSGRLTALQNVLNSQISDEQLQRLIQNVWSAASVKKLKVDQVEALISWAKEDYFVDEVEAVLALIDEEGRFARSDW